MTDKKTILNNMLDRLPNDYDRTDGGLFFDTLSPISFELEKVYEHLEYRFKNTFPETAEGEYLDLLVKQVNIKRREATKSKGFLVFSGENTVVIPKGTRVASDSYIFETLKEQRIENKEVRIEATSQETGKNKNVLAGAINKLLDEIQGINSVRNEEAFIDGTDIESDRELLERYLIKVREPQTSGNIFDYKKWSLDVEGVGACKIFPLAYGNGTVKISIIGTDRLPANRELILRVQNYINERKPIGADARVERANSLNIETTLKVRHNKLQNEEYLKKNIESSINDYIKSLAFKEDFVSYAKIGYCILKVDGVSDYKDLTLNGTKNNIDIATDTIAVLNSCNISFYEV